MSVIAPRASVAGRRPEFEREPLDAGSPLAGCPNLLLTPHIAGVTVESNLRVSMLVAEKVAKALRKRGSIG